MRFLISFSLAALLWAAPVGLEAQEAPGASDGASSQTGTSPRGLQRWHPDAYADPNAPAASAPDERGLELEYQSPESELPAYTLEETEQRLRRARGGLATSVVVLAGSPLMFFAGLAGATCPYCGDDSSPNTGYAIPLMATGAVLFAASLFGVGVFTGLLRERKAERARLRKASGRLHWGPATAGLAF